jgi:hypothetical protein
VLRLLSAHGVFQRIGDAYAHTPASQLLRTDHPQSMRAFARMQGFPAFWHVWEHSPSIPPSGGSSMKQ